MEFASDTLELANKRKELKMRNLIAEIPQTPFRLVRESGHSGITHDPIESLDSRLRGNDDE